jgi:hypothetical protein
MILGEEDRFLIEAVHLEAGVDVAGERHRLPAAPADRESS